MRRVSPRPIAALAALTAFAGTGCGFLHGSRRHESATVDSMPEGLPGPSTVAENLAGEPRATTQSLHVENGSFELASADESEPSAGIDKAAPRRTLAAVSTGVAPAASAERLTINGTVHVRTVDVSEMVAAVRARTAEVGGTVVGEVVSGNAEDGYAQMRLRLPPAQAVPFADWLATRATLELRNLETLDVSRQYFDQALAIKNLHITMARLQELAKRPDAPLRDVLETERELTRVRGELERIEGEHRLLEDQIARATLTVNIRPRRGANTPPVHVEPELKFELVPRLALFHFLDAGTRAQDRWGGGATVMFSRAFSLELLALPRDGADARSFLFDVTVAGYSDFLGGGRRRFLNPFLGLRLGGAYLNGHGAYAFGGEIGVELVHVKNFIVELAGRAHWLVYHKDVPYDVGLTGTLGVGVPF